MALFEKVATQVDFPAMERAILAWWDEHDVFNKLRAKNAGRPRWSFLDGPITANNPMGVHHAWGRTYKDVFQRYFAMTGRELRYQNGFDCQGLWVEVEVEKELGLKSKRDIENLVTGDRPASIAKFVQMCKDRVNKFARVQTEQSIRLGMWMDWDRTDADWAKSPDERKSYFTMAERNNYTIWAFLKKCHQRGLIYRGYDAMPWCGRCGVGISEQEMKEGYKDVEHRACFVKLPLLDRPGENLLVWTTTPWTLTSNVGAAVNPELVYLKVKLKEETYYVSEGAFKLNRMESTGDENEPGGSSARKSKRDWLDGVPHLKSIEQLFKEKAGKDGFEIVGEVKGAAMLDWRYRGPFDDLPAQQHPRGFPAEVAGVVEKRGWAPAKSAAESHRVISGGSDVTDTEGTGIVHTAPGCGQIDFEWGKQFLLPPIAPIDESGEFHEGFGTLTGRSASDPATADAVFDELKKKDVLFATERYVHRYPHCWRCKTELLYRLVDEWFIDMGPRNTEEGFRGEIMKVVDQVKFLPESLNGRARERDWLWNMNHWMISKKRYWGLALPIWVDEVTGDFEVIGSREELQARAVEGWAEFAGHTPHRPHVDQIKIRNPNTGNLMTRIPDVGNPWLDAGIVAFSTMKWPSDYWKQWYPADFITESFPGQFRNWFYALLAMSTMMADGQPPFKTLLGHGLVRDEHGEEMHKSKGNAIEFNAAADKIGADVMRWLYCRSNPVGNVNFGYAPADEVRAKFVLKLWNTYAFFVNYARLDKFDPSEPQVPMKQRTDLDRWILSDLQLLVQRAHTAFNAFDIMSFCLECEEFVDDKLSNWYVRRSRRRFWNKTTDLDECGRRLKLAGYQTLYEVLITLTKLIAPVTPFLAETMWQNLVDKTIASDANPPSVHLEHYPKADGTVIDSYLSKEVESLLRIVTLGNAARNAARIKVRQPLAELIIQSTNNDDAWAIERFRDVICEELNVRKVIRHICMPAKVGEFELEGNDANLIRDVPLLKAVAKLNKKSAAPKLGPKLKEAEGALAKLDANELAKRLGGGVELAGVMLDANDIAIEYKADDGWVGVADRGTQVALDARITNELKLEGLAREVIRQVQDARKNAGLDVADKIVLCLQSDAALLQAAIDAHRGTIEAETQAVEWAATMGDDVQPVAAKIDGMALSIRLRKSGGGDR